MQIGSNSKQYSNPNKGSGGCTIGLERLPQAEMSDKRNCDTQIPTCAEKNSDAKMPRTVTSLVCWETG